MAFANTATSFGMVSRVMHWTMALGVIIMLALGTRLSDLQPDLSTLWLYGLHKTIGLILLMLAVLRVIWHRISPPPRPIGPPTAWETRAARMGHAFLYVLLIAIPLSGWFASSATGIDVMIFDRWVVAPIAPVSEIWEYRGFAMHRILTNILFGLIAIHAMAGIKREMQGDGTLTRMIKGRTGS